MVAESYNRGQEDLIGAILVLRVEGRQGSGRTKWTSEEVIRADIIACGMEP